jgi:hypothetical protein
MNASLNIGSGLLNGYFPFMPTTGNVFHAGSTNANAKDDTSHGTRPDNPFATLDYAVGRCTANNGDIIIVQPGHVETVAAASGLALDVAGVTVIGLGNGGNRPTVNLTATGSTVVISAASVTVRNVIFVGTIDAVVTPILITGADVGLFDIETRDASSTQATDFITATTATRLTLDGWTHRGDAAAGAETAISIVGGDGITIRNFWIDGNFGTACIENVTTACTNITIGGGHRMNYARTRNAADVIVTLVATATGNIGPNIYARVADDGANITEAFVAADGNFFQPISIVNADGEVGLNTNITASVDI